MGKRSVARKKEMKLLRCVVKQEERSATIDACLIPRAGLRRQNVHLLMASRDL